MVKKDAVAVINDSSYPILAAEGGSMIVKMIETLGPTGLFNLTRMPMPSGGGTVFEVPSIEGSEAAKTLDVVIGHMQTGQRTWYRKSYEDSGGGEPPACSSRNGIDGYGNNSDNPEAEDGKHDCITCPRAKFGSKGARAQACSESAVMFLFREGSRLPLLFSAPPSSLKAIQMYSLGLWDRGEDVETVVTRLSLTSDQNPDGLKYSKVGFEFLTRLEGPHREMMSGVRKQLRGWIAQQSAPVDA